MDNFIITIIIFNPSLIKIHPAKWFLWPHWLKKDQSSEKMEIVNAKFQYPNGNQSITSFKRRYQVAFIIQWLCFTIQITYMRKTEVADIYPADYNYGTDPEWKEKYERLSATDFFN